MRKLSIGINWQGQFDIDNVIEQAKVADDAGVDSCFVAEAWGRDAFTILAVLARETNNIKLGTSIVNIYSRSPAALAQHFATLDELSGGRMIIGIGTRAVVPSTSGGSKVPDTTTCSLRRISSLPPK